MSKIIAFNINDQIDLQAVVECSLEIDQPIILNISKKAIEFAGLDYLLSLLQVAKKRNPKLLTQLDHAHDMDLIYEAITRRYFDIVMADFSSLSIDQNIKMTKKVVELGDRDNIWVEGEIGSVPEGVDRWNEQCLTTVSDAIRFVKETNVHYLAVSVGNAHGFGRKQRLRQDLIKKLSLATKVPLVLHGADFLDPNEIQASLHNGIAKVNIGPEIRVPYFQAITKSHINEEIATPDHRVVLSRAKKAMKKDIDRLIRLVYQFEQIKQ